MKSITCYIDKYLRKLLNPDYFDLIKVKSLIEDLYEYSGSKKPEVIFCLNIEDLILKINDYCRTHRKIYCKELITDQLICSFSFLREIVCCQSLTTKASLPDNFQFLIELFDNCQLFLPLEDVCFVVHNYVSINCISTFDKYLLHNDNGPAVEYLKSDNSDCSFYFSNGIQVPKELITTPADKLPTDLYYKEKNADVRTEILRKIGVDRFITEGRVVDSWKNYDSEKVKNYHWWKKSEYHVIDMAKLFPGVYYAPHLYMKNQTTGVYHLEPVAPYCKTISDALTDRYGGANESEYIIMSIK